MEGWNQEFSLFGLRQKSGRHPNRVEELDPRSPDFSVKAWSFGQLGAACPGGPRVWVEAVLLWRSHATRTRTKNLAKTICETCPYRLCHATVLTQSKADM